MGGSKGSTTITMTAALLQKSPEKSIKIHGRGDLKCYILVGCFPLFTLETPVKMIPRVLRFFFRLLELMVNLSGLG